MKILRFCTVPLFLFLLSHCVSRPYGKPAASVPKTKLQLNAEGKGSNTIAFLTFLVTQTDSTNNTYDFRLISSKFVDGTLKRAGYAGDEIIAEPNSLYFQITGTNRSSKGDSYQRVDNPLATVYEGPGENGTLEKKLVQKKSGELVIRFQYDGSAKQLLIYKPELKSSNLKLLYHALL